MSCISGHSPNLYWSSDRHLMMQFWNHINKYQNLYLLRINIITQTKFIVDHSMHGSRERRGSGKSNYLVHIVNLPKKASDSPVKHNNPSDPLPPWRYCLDPRMHILYKWMDKSAGAKRIDRKLDIRWTDRHCQILERHCRLTDRHCLITDWHCRITDKQCRIKNRFL